MTIVLTNKNGSKLVVVLSQVAMFEPDAVSGTHVVFNENLVRQVTETVDQITAAIGAVVLP